MIRMRVGMILVALLAIGAGGCGDAADADRELVRIWHTKASGERALLETVARRFNESNTRIEIETLFKSPEELRNLFVTSAVGGQGPELVYGPADNVGLLVLTETLRPIEDVFGPEYLAQFHADGLVTVGDSTWIIGDQVGNHLSFVYNRELIPEPPRTWSEFLAMAEELSGDTDGDGRIDQYALAIPYQEPYFFVPFLTGFGGWVYDAEGNPSFDNEATVKAIEFLIRLREQNVMPREVDYDIMEFLFKEGRAAAVINGPWAWSGYVEAGIDMGIARIPIMDETGLWSSPMTSVLGYSVNANVGDDELDAVREVLEYLVSSEMQIEMAMTLATTPTHRTARADSLVLANELLQASTRQIEVGKPMPLDPSLRQVWDGARGPYQKIMAGALTADEGAREMQEQIEKLIADTFL